MKLFTKAQRDQLLRNGRAAVKAAIAGTDHDPKPVVKLFTPSGGGTWLLTELSPAHPDIAFGLCDMGFGFPELGNVSISEIKAVRLTLKLNGIRYRTRAPGVERDLHWRAKGTISQYAEAARMAQGITENLEVAV